MADIILNSKYAPGVSTYGTEGKPGKKGNNGKSLFYITNRDMIEKYIDNNIIFGLSSDMKYTYQDGDSFITQDGEVYMYNGKNSENKITSLGGLNIKSESELLVKKDGYIVNKDNAKMYISDNTEAIDGSSSYLLNIDASNGKLLSLSSSNDTHLNIEHDVSSNAFKIISNKDIILDANVSLKTSNNINVDIPEGYFLLNAIDNDFKDKIEIEKNDKEITISISEENIVNNFFVSAFLCYEVLSEDRETKVINDTYFLPNDSSSNEINYTIILPDDTQNVEHFFIELNHKTYFYSKKIKKDIN